MPRNQPIDLVGPLADTFLFHRMTAREELGRLFELSVDCLSKDFAVRSTDLLGRTLTVRLELPRGGWRYFDGHVCRFGYLGVTASGRYARYHLLVRPWLWFLTRSADCRIFQDKTVPEILREVFREHGFSDIEEALYGEYRRWEYCVQYRETDFDFVSRLMEQEGIYYYFRHEHEDGRGRHILVLADDYSAHVRGAGYETVHFQRATEARPGEIESIGEWRVSHEIEPDVYSLGDFDFTRPKAGLLVSRRAAPEVQPATGQVYDYPGEYRTRAEGDAYVRTRMEELQARHERVHGTASARGLAVGNLFALHDHPRSDQNREYLVVSALHTLRSMAYESELEPESPTAPVYACELTAMPSHLPYRSPRITRRPVVEGPQTAIVVGPAGEKVWTDQYARVKVRFHWDHRDSDTAGAAIPDERRSCWLRVSQNWAGQQWGEMYLPHVGQEVIVSFLEGDPDRPLVTGRVYNADNMPPLDLPAGKYKSVVARDHYGNELVFDGTPGSEHILMYSPHHGSMLELGKSVASCTTSDKLEFTLGSSASLAVGAKLEAFVGLKGEASVGPSFELNVGPSFTYRCGREIEGTLRDVFKRSKEDTIFDTDETFSVGAGKSGKNSVIFAGKQKGKGQELELSIGALKRAMQAGNPLFSQEDWGAIAALGVFAAASVGVSVAIGASLGSDEAEDFDKSQAAAAEIPTLIGLAPLIAYLVKWGIRAASEPEAIRHDEDARDSWLRLSETEAKLDAKQTVCVAESAGTLKLGKEATEWVMKGKSCQWESEEFIFSGSRIELG